MLERDVLKSVFGLDTDAIRNGAVSFPKSAERAADEIRAGEGWVALYLNALSPEDVFRVTEAGDVMPQKSTFFYPKVPTGLVFRADGTHVATIAQEGLLRVKRSAQRPDRRRPSAADDFGSAG